MLTIAIPQLYCGASGKRGAYNRQEVGLARAFAALGCRAVVLYPAPGAAAPETECPAPGVKVLYLPARAWRVNAFYQSWQPLLDEQVDAVHVMGDNSLGVPGLYHFCRRHGIFFYSQLGALRSQSGSAVIRAAMDLLCRRNLAIYRRTPSFAKTAAVQRELEELRVPCAGVLPVGLDTAIIPAITAPRAALRAQLGLAENAKYILFVGRLDAYKRPLDVAAVLRRCRQTGKPWSSARAAWLTSCTAQWTPPGLPGGGGISRSCPMRRYTHTTMPAMSFSTATTARYSA